MRVKVTLACTDCKQRNYNTMKNKKNDPDRLEMRKYCPFCHKHTAHKETFIEAYMIKIFWGCEKMAAHDSVNKSKKPVTSGNRIVSFFKELKAEFKRITWASKEDVKKAIATVMTFCLIYVVIVGLLDYGFKSLVGVIFK